MKQTLKTKQRDWWKVHQHLQNPHSTFFQFLIHFTLSIDTTRNRLFFRVSIINSFTEKENKSWKSVYWWLKHSFFPVCVLKRLIICIFELLSYIVKEKNCGGHNPFSLIIMVQDLSGYSCLLFCFHSIWFSIVLFCFVLFFCFFFLWKKMTILVADTI